MRDQLKNVQQIQATRAAFAAILGDGSVVSCGCHPTVNGRGDTRAARDQLRMAAILRDGSVVTWGSADSGGDSSTVRDQLENVQQIQALRYAFAAMLALVVTAGPYEIS